eukprot:gene3108-1404_t
MRPLQICLKLLQRQTYSCLSTKAGTWFCLGGLLLLGISIIQFGELFLEWSMQKYKVTFSSHHDNIAGRTFEERLCLPRPIDVVYTWVNGSDPQLVMQLTELKGRLVMELNATVLARSDSKKDIPNENPRKPFEKGKLKSSKVASSSHERFKWKDKNVCPYPNCVAYNAIAVSGLPANVTVLELSSQNKFLSDFEFSNLENVFDPSVKVLTFDESFDIGNLGNKTIILNGKEMKFTKAFVSSTIRLGAKKLDGIGIINYVPDEITPKIIEAALRDEKLYGAKLSIENSTAVIKFQDKNKAKQFILHLRGQIILKGKKFKILPATFLWKPLTSLEEGRDSLEEDVSSSRFADNEELKYSLRSIEKYAPWIRKIFIVTNGQIPSWLNLDHPRVKLVTHQELFLNKTHLPTFSSPAIETHIHRIPGLSKQFIYMNDDVFFGDYVWPDDFYTHSKGQKVYLTWPVPNCNEGCPATWINDKYCDKPCNVSECDWDGGDCLKGNPSRGFSYSPQSFLGSAYSAVGEYCNGGCANSWIGDRYCDANCNVFNCGFDAGDCGLTKFNQLSSIEATNLKTVMAITPGLKSFYVNFTSLLGEGILTEGEFIETSVIRTAIFSKKFKILTVMLYANFTETVAFTVSGYKDLNKTMPIKLQFNITVDTYSKPIATTLVTPTSVSYTKDAKQTLFPYTVYDAANKELLKSGASIDKSRLTFGNKTRHEMLEWFKMNEKDIPAIFLKQLNQEERELREGYLTELGYNRSKLQIIKSIYGQLQNQTDRTKPERVHHRSRRHLLSAEDQLHSQMVVDPARHTENGRQFSVGRQSHSRSISILNDLVMSTNNHINNAREYKKNEKRKGTIKNIWQWLARYGNWDPIDSPSSTSPFRWERQKFFLEVISLKERLQNQQKYKSSRKPSRKLLDTFASSLLHVSRIYNRQFGYKARKVPAHMPHFVDVDVVNEMQRRFWKSFDETSSHKIRSPQDMQFAFSYSYYLMDLPASINMSSIFQELDADMSGVLNDRELRTLAAKMFSLPLQSTDIKNLEEMLMNCSGIANGSLRDSSTPLLSIVVTRNMFVKCEPIKRVFEESKSKAKYKFEVLGDEDVTFKMIRNNVSYLIHQLDWIRKNRRKFVCLNDNINHELPQSKLIRTILKDFLESQFPERSQFELPPTYRNKFLKIEELIQWKNDLVIEMAKTRVEDICSHNKCFILASFSIIGGFW